MSGKSDFDIDPVTVPEIWQKKTKWEKCLEKIPIIGWICAGLIENDRFCRARAELYAQIEKRPSFSQRKYYRENEEKVTIQIATMIMYEMNWPTNIFSQDDLLEALIFDGDLACRIFEKIEILFDMPEQCLSKCYDDNPNTTFIPNITFGDFINCVVKYMGTR
jgi:hypothetical protein